jgi:L-threonylcarbamoyladenylate synthase
MELLLPEDPSTYARAATALASNGVLLYPTDTLYGLGVDAFSDEAVSRLYAIKGRDEKKPIHAIVADMTMAARYGHVNNLARALAEAFIPGPLTLILKKKEWVDTGIGRRGDTIGIRIPKSAVCLKLSRAFDIPITTTSANLAGEPCESSIAAILEQLGSRASGISLAIDAGELPQSAPSTIVDVSSGRAILLREGAIPASEIANIVSLS